MKKYYFIIFILTIFILVITGCSIKQEQTNVNGKNNAENSTEQNQNNQFSRWEENFAEASLNDLIIGQQILVMGEENSDGSISANQVMIGNEETDFENMDRAMRVSTDNNIENQDNKNQPIQPQVDPDGERPDFTQMQNMSEEERMKMREEMRIRREAEGGARPGGGMVSMSRISGEIIKKDSSTITLKITKGGSKLIFYSEETKVLKIK